MGEDTFHKICSDIGNCIGEKYQETKEGVKEEGVGYVWNKFWDIAAEGYRRDYEVNKMIPDLDDFDDGII